MSAKLAVRAGIGTFALFFGLSALALGAKREDPDAAGELYGDLYVIERDGNGEPVLRPVTYDDHETEVTVLCQQPLGSNCSLLPLWGECTGDENDVGGVFPDCYFDPEVYDACGVHVDSVDLTQEVSFGRGSVARAQDFVIDSAYAEFIKTINEAVGIGFDPAGRIQLTLPAEGSEVADVVKTIDAPLENLGLYREIMTNGCLGTVTDLVMGEEGEELEITFALNADAIDLLCGDGGYPGGCSDPRTGPLVCDYPTYGSEKWWTAPTTPDAAGVTDEDLLLATSFLAGATDKGDGLSFDEIINLNTYLGLNTYTWTKNKKERTLEVTYFDFGGFTYARGSVFPSPTPWDLLWSTGTDAYASGTIDVFNTTNSEAPPGVDLDGVNLTVCRDGAPLPVVCDVDGETVCGGANYFAQAAEHARKTIWFIHNWEVPEIAY